MEYKPRPRRLSVVMSISVSTRREIPSAPYYVLSNDTFMSGWGHAENRVNTVILPCQSYDEAEQVAAYARGRSDQTRVRILSTKPRLQCESHLYSLMSRDDAPAWYPDE